MSRIGKITICLAVLFLFAACSKDNEFDCFKSTGADITEVRDTGPFGEVQVNEQINLNVVKGAEYKVEVTAGKHIIKNITTKIKNGILIIDNINKCNFVRGYKRHVTVTVTVPYIKRVDNEGVGTVVFDADYSQDTLLLEAQNSGDIHVSGTYNEIRTSSHGNGDIYMNGTCNSLYVYTNGINFVRGENLIVNNYIFVETLSIGDCSINATKASQLDYHIWDTGNIYYTGSPAIINNVGDGTEKGKLIKKD